MNSLPNLVMPLHKPPDQQRIVAFLAEESRVPVDDVEKLYEQARAELAVGAHITQFLHIFAIRNVQEILRRRADEKLAQRAAGRPLLAPKRLLTPLLTSGPVEADFIDKSLRP